MIRTRRAALHRPLASVLAGALVAMAAVVGVAAPASAATTELTATAAVVPNEKVTVSVSGSGYQDAPVYPGQPFRSVYVGLVEAGSFDANQESTPSASLRVSDAGEVTGELVIPASALDRTRSYEVIAWPTRSFPQESNVMARTAVSIDWAALFPRAAEATATTLAASPEGTAVEGADVTLTGTVSPAAEGTITFSTADLVVGSSPVENGVATVRTAALAVGSHQIVASFVPADTGAFEPSASDGLAFTVTPRQVDPEPQPRVPALTLSKSAGLNPAGEEITVTGTGFDPAISIYLTTCTDRPLSEIDFAFIQAGCTTGAKLVTADPKSPSMVAFADDGSFQTTLTVAPKGDSTAVYTIADHRAMTNRSQDAKATVSFATVPVEPLPTPTLTVTPNTDVDPSGATLTIVGKNFTDTSRDAAGFFVSVGTVTDGWKPSEGGTSADRSSIASKRVQARPGSDLDTLLGWTPNADGTYDFTWTVHVDKAAADGTQPKNGPGRFGVHTFGTQAVTGVQADKELFVPITWAEVAPQPEPVKDPKITVTPNTALDPAAANTLVVSGAGFVGDSAANGAYVVFGETSLWAGNGPLPANGWVQLAWVRPAEIVRGAFTVELTVPAGSLDPTKSYHVATSAAHGLSITDRSLDTFAPVTVAQPAAPFVTFPGSASVAPGGVLEIVGGGFAEGQVVTAVAHSEPVTIGTATADAGGRVSFSWTVPAGFEVGEHTLELSVDGAVVASARFGVVAAIVPPAVEVAAAPSCVARSVTGATLDWGVKQSYRSYITGPIAKGGISGGWAGGSGAYSPENDRGRVSFGGSVHYTGHSGLLDMTLSNPRIQITGAGTASLILNVQSKGYNGSPDVNANGVVFATLSLPAASRSGDSISWNGAAATLTAAGAEAFGGFYSAGEALDAVSVTFPLGAEVPCDASTDATLAATGGQAPIDAAWIGAGMLLLGALAVTITRRRRTVA